MAVACASCGAEQPPGTRFCGSCGAPLVRACPTCGAEAPAGAAFCPACGASLREGVSRAAVAAEREERRVVTVLFADLAGSTALGSRIDPEDLRTLQGELFELVNSEVERFGGISEKFVGDAVLAVFGVPLAHDDDAERAVRATLAVRDRFSGFARDVVRRHGVDVGLRIGVNTGEVVAGREAAARGELMVSGDAVNVGARLQQRAEPGQVLVGERTHAATRRAIRYASVGAAPAKGKDTLLPAWEAIAVMALPGVRGVDGLSAQMIGREEELVVLQALTSRVARERAPQLVTIYGHAGVGKTRLLTEFAADLDGALLLQGRCLPYGDGITYWPVAEAAKGLAGILDSDPSDAALHKLETAIRVHVTDEQVKRVVDGIAWTIGLGLPEAGGSDLRGPIRDAWLRLLTGLGREQLTALVVEDVHWASEPLLELLEHLTDHLADTAVLILCTARPEFLDARASWGGGLRDSTSIRLGPLPERESATLVEALLGTGKLPRELTGRIVERAEGNPFYVEEILQMLIDRGAIARVDGGWSVRGDLDAVALPDSVHGVIAARIDLLDADARDALRRCAVVGRVFWPRAVGADDEVIAGLGRRGLVSEQPGTAIEGMREFVFKHAFTQDVAYATLPRAERRDLHCEVGHWIETMAPDRSAETAELAAYHYERAREFGDSSPEVRRRCFELSLMAGEAALARGAAGTAKRLTGRAVQLAEGPRESAISLVAQGRAMLLSNDPQEIGRSPGPFAAARDLASSLGDRRLEADALSWLSRADWMVGRFDEALPAARGAVDVLAGLDETPQHARALARLSQLEMLNGDPNAETRAREAVAVARRVGDVHAELNARINVVVAVANRGQQPDIAESHAIVERALEAANLPEAHRCLVNTLWVVQSYESYENVVREIGAMQRALTDSPPVEGLGTYFELSYAVLVDVRAARWEAVDRALTRGVPSASLTGVALLWRELLGGMALRRGDLEAAERPLRELRELAAPTGEPQRILPMVGVVLPFAALTGDRDLVLELVESVLGLTDRHWSQPSTASIPRALARAGEGELLERVAHAFADVRRGTDAPRLVISANVAEGLLAAAAGRADDAVDLLGTAAELEWGLGWTYSAACIELEVAAALVAAKRDDEAAASHARAAAVLEPLGCVNPY